MPLLRLTQHIEKKADHYRVEIAFEDHDGSRQTADVTFKYEFTDEDRADLRWYLEDFLQYPMDPAPKIASRIETRMTELGTDLFKKVFQATEDARDLWSNLRAELDNTRVEVFTDVKGAVALPWELLRDPKTDAALALRAKSFVRSYTKGVQRPDRPAKADKIRILLVICRPGGGEDVPFRSVAGKLIKSLSDEARETFELDVLRPPTFEQLSKVLRNAKAKGEPYHIVHFDGHGGYLDTSNDKPSEFLRRLVPLMLSGPREGSHGFLFFEHPKPDNTDENYQLVDGLVLGKLLVETDVPVLVLNACRSAHAEIQEKPNTKEEAEDVHSQVRAFGSLAQEVMDTGVAGVVAMRYNVYVVTAAQFVADLYAALAQGQTLGEAVSMGRKQLAAQPLREIAFDPLPLQDWSVPVVYEAAPIQLFPRETTPKPIKIDLSKTTRAEDNLPRPDVGFFGRDETILALDRAFDTQPVVLLHAYAGSGKTMTAAEFARWYSQTGGLQGPILFTSFEQYKPLAQVLSAVEETYRPILEQNNIHWLALDDDKRLNLTLQIFQQIPPLWIWDNVEPVNGFPTGTDSAWSLAEQRELRTFLQIVTGQTKTKFLLTSRRDEQAWLGDIPARISLPPMPKQECFELTREIAKKQGHRITVVEDWMPLIKYARGNPMTLTVVVGQALRDGKKTKAQIEAFVEKLRNGEAAFKDEEPKEGRSKSLGASLSYGFEQAFSEEERKVLALLHFFQGFVDVRVLKLMVADEDWGIGSKDFTHETGIAILDKAADIGLLTSHGGGYYTIHPALPWFFRSLFEQYYPNETSAANHQPSTDNLRATRAYVESMGGLSNYYHDQYEGGNRDVIAPLRREEPNLLHARYLARQHGWWNRVISTMQGLRKLYSHTGRRAEWKHLVDEIVPDFVGKDDLPLSGREQEWSLVTEHRVRLAMESRNWREAERLQHVRVGWNRHRAALLIAHPAESLSDGEKNILRTLAVSMQLLGSLQSKLGKTECVSTYQEGYELSLKIEDQSAAVTAFNLGHVFMGDEVPTLQNLDEAEKWYRRSFELFENSDWVGKSGCLHQLGMVSQKRFAENHKANGDKTEILRHISAAVSFFEQALEITPPDAVDDLAATHNQLGITYSDANDLERALHHYSEAIRYKELAGNIYAAGTTRHNMAIALAQNGRLSDALLYARTALRNFESYEGRAKQDEDNAKGLIAEIEQAIEKSKK